ncbi:SDR family NAD(P)-dependent oxidoreductase [Actinotalea sp. M2MS4P-6]|uniref:SDR family NAD(P)-dependent oxidoreductase n=1 Tax=Actinotalea sp. M2MS4P-6 TaxID=2983762 RepID=UPI0021E43B29|nr:SDR family NAD(P)-dependent oxidoreductase [Actinotalea sp. M2MS4P-6]MCV2394373.1 SDR family NAD(P)-dependent oxidoreductase [Actinotalea sp. M2MS4P-6]
MTAPMDGRVVLVTGAADRAGRRFVERYAAAGAAVVVNHLPTQGADAAEVVRGIAAAGGRAVAVEADVTDVAACRTLVAETTAAFGRLDVLVHNASTFRPAPWLEVDEQAWDSSLGVNLKGPFFLSQAAARVMLEQGEGRIVAMVGNSLTEAWPTFVPHSVAKSALARLMEQLAVALAPVVACNAIAPSQFFRSDDGTNDALRAGRGEVEPHEDGTVDVAGHRLREIDLDAVWEALLHLSTSSLQVTGTTLRIDGGKALV